MEWFFFWSFKVFCLALSQLTVTWRPGITLSQKWYCDVWYFLMDFYNLFCPRNLNQSKSLSLSCVNLIKFSCTKFPSACSCSSGLNSPEEEIVPAHVSKHWPQSHQNDSFDVKLRKLCVFWAWKFVRGFEVLKLARLGPEEFLVDESKLDSVDHSLSWNRFELFPLSLTVSLLWSQQL